MKKTILPVLIAALTLVVSCDQAALDTWNSSKLELRLKGTYESNGARAVQTDAVSLNKDGTGFTISVAGILNPVKIMIDIAEIRLTDSAGNVVKFSNYRKVFSVNLSDTDTNGFFGDTGLLLASDEVTPGVTYTSATIYLRKMAFDSARKTVKSAVSWEDHTFTFNEVLNTVGFDFNQLQPNSAFDRHQKNANYINRVFPVSVPIPGGFVFNPSAGKNVLELRLMIKNLIKAFEYHYYYNTTAYVAHYWAINDWLRQARMDYNEPFIGGNLLGVGRGYIEGQTGTIDVAAATSARWVIAIPAGADKAKYLRSSTAIRSGHVAGLDLPVSPLTHVDLILNYCLNYETVRVANDAAIAAGTFFTSFTTAWTECENAAIAMTLAPHVIYKLDGTTTTMTNIAPGSYDVYVSDQTTLFAVLTTGNLTQLGTTVTVTAGSVVAP